jgi:hypothetical protein
MPLGHLVDLIWRWKSLLVYLGAALIAASLLIMVFLIGSREAMIVWLPAETWFVLSTLLAPIGYVIQDAVADAMTVEAVPTHDENGRPFEPARRKLMHTTMQTLGRVAIIGGGVLVALINLYLFNGVQGMSVADKAQIYRDVYLMALVIPVFSVLGVALAAWLRARERHQPGPVAPLKDELTEPNWWLLGGSLAFVLFALFVGLGNASYKEEIVFAGSMAIVLFLIARLTRELDPEARATLLGTAVVIFVFRAVPGPGPGVTWWMIDELGVEQQFLSVLSLIGAALTLAGMFVFRRFMAERSIAYVVGFLTLAAALFALPVLGLYHGLHQWTAAFSGGLVDARFIVLVDTALESPLGQIAMIPMLAWIANSAPAQLKATYFAVMASFTNLALSLSQLGTKYLNQFYVVSRELRNPASGAIQTPADYSQLGELLLAQILIALALPFLAILASRLLHWRSA